MTVNSNLRFFHCLSAFDVLEYHGDVVLQNHDIDIPTQHDDAHVRIIMASYSHLTDMDHLTLLISDNS